MSLTVSWKVEVITSSKSKNYRAQETNLRALPGERPLGHSRATKVLHRSGLDTFFSDGASSFCTGWYVLDRRLQQDTPDIDPLHGFRSRCGQGVVLRRRKSKRENFPPSLFRGWNGWRKWHGPFDIPCFLHLLQESSRKGVDWLPSDLPLR